MNSIYPISTKAYTIGSTSKVWSGIYSNNFYLYSNNSADCLVGQFWSETSTITTTPRHATLILGNNVSTRGSNHYGVLRLYNDKSGFIDIRRRSMNGSDSSGYTFYLPDATSYAVWSNKEDETIGGKTYLADGTTENGDKPVYISATGQTTACNGIVVTTGAQTFSGSKTFSSTVAIGTATYGTGAIKMTCDINNETPYSILYKGYNNNGTPNGNICLSAGGGDLYIGYENTDAIRFIVPIKTGIQPKVHGNNNIGSTETRWKNIYISDYVNTGALILGDNDPNNSQTAMIGYGTDTPQSAIKIPVVGRVYFQIINE